MLEIPAWLGYSVLAVIGGGLAWLAYALFVASKSARTPDHPSEAFYRSERRPGGDRESLEFPSLSDRATRTLSIIVPAYNEEARIGVMLDEMLAFLEEYGRDNAGFTFEIIVVDDGSRDRTCEVVLGYVDRLGSDRLRLLKLFKNHGKGGAVRKGMLRARGAYLLMADADGATRASDFDVVYQRLKGVERVGRVSGAEVEGIALGSRAHLEAAAKADRAWYRTILMFGFHAFVTILFGGHGIQDTQCGFKLFTRATARRVFPVLHIERWAFDVEIVFLASSFKDIPLVEVPVNWQEIEGSKLSVVSATIQMARDLLIIRLCYLLGIWKPTIEKPSTFRSEGAAVPATSKQD